MSLTKFENIDGIGDLQRLIKSDLSTIAFYQAILCICQKNCVGACGAKLVFSRCFAITSGSRRVDPLQFLHQLKSLNNPFFGAIVIKYL